MSSWRIIATSSLIATMATPGIGRALPGDRVLQAEIVASGVPSSPDKRRFQPRRRPPLRYMPAARTSSGFMSARMS
jgi:hypothetical protein